MHNLRPRGWSDATFVGTVFVLGGFGVVLMVLPVVVGFLMSLTAGNTLRFPPEGLSLRWYVTLFDPAESGRIQTAALTSLEIGLWATALTVLIAVPAALGLASPKGRRFSPLEPAFMLPLVLPTLVYGVAALMFFSRLGIPTSR